MSASLLDELGFPQMRYIRGRTSIADMYKRGERCGIYVLRFANGEFYAGKSVEVTRRYVGHRIKHRDIEEITFRRVLERELNHEERNVIEQLESNGVPLRNITFASIPKGESDFDLIMPPAEQSRWLEDLSYVDDEGERLIDPDLRRRYERQFERLLKMPYAQEVFDILQTYVKAGIPAIRRGEVSFWACSCLPTSNVYSRINVNWQEVLTVFDSDGSLWFSFHLADSPLEEPFGDNPELLFERHPTLVWEDHRYAPGGSDQIRLLIRGAENAKTFITDVDILPAIRLFNLRLMQKGPCTYGRFHCMDLADVLVSD